MHGILEKTMTDLQVIRPILEYFIWGILLIVIVLFCFASLLQTRKRDDYDQIDDEYNINEYRKNKERMGL